MLLVENLENSENNENLKFHHPEITLSKIWMYFSSLLCSTICMCIKLAYMYTYIKFISICFTYAHFIRIIFISESILQKTFARWIGAFWKKKTLDPCLILYIVVPDSGCTAQINCRKKL